MTKPRRILVVDDTPRNTKLLVDLLEANDFAVATAASGADALASIEADQPDVVLLDVLMPGMDGYEVCRRIRGNPNTALLPVVMVTALDPAQERVKGIEAGADEFLSKPINAAELLARVRSLLRIRQLHEEIEAWNRTLETRVAEQVAKLDQLERLRGFFAPAVAKVIADDVQDLIRPHRRKVSVVFADLRGFTEFAESAEPEEMMEILGEYYVAMGRVISEYEGVLERFAGDGLLVVFNDPVEVAEPEARAVLMAIAMREACGDLQRTWARRGHRLALGVGIATGYATMGVIDFEGRRDYATLGSVPNRAARLSDMAGPGQILVAERFLSQVESLVRAERIGELTLKGFRHPVVTYNVVGAAVDKQRS